MTEKAKADTKQEPLEIEAELLYVRSPIPCRLIDREE
jgi:hypothetical protein